MPQFIYIHIYVYIYISISISIYISISISISIYLSIYLSIYIYIYLYIYGTSKIDTFSSSDSCAKLRPAVLSSGSFNYNRTCYLCDLLLQLIPSEYFCMGNFLFVSQIKSVNPTGEFLASYDVTNIFTIFRRNIKIVCEHGTYC